MAERERRIAPPYGGVFVPRTRVMDRDDLQRAVWRMAHEIVERNHGLEPVVLIGLQTGGVQIAARLGEALHAIEGVRLEEGSLDVAFYRDDIGLRPVLPEAVTDIPFELDGRVVVLADDVLFTGRTIRAALQALNDYGRPRSVQLAPMAEMAALGVRLFTDEELTLKLIVSAESRLAAVSNDSRVRVESS